MIKITLLTALLLFITLAVSTFVSAGGYNVTLATEAVYYSKVAYCNYKNIENWNCDACPKFPGVRNVTTAIVEDDGSAGWCGFDPANNRIVLAFRGTVSLDGWIIDGDFFKTLYDPQSGCGDNCFVHQGLYWAFLEMMKKLGPAMFSLSAAHPDAELFVTGHSMGAAQAGFGQTWVLTKLASHKGPKRFFTFGEPRIGTIPFVIWQQKVLAEAESFRCTNYGDPVVHLPPLIFDDLDLGKWIHNPREIFYKNNFGPATDFKVCDGGVRVINGTQTVVEDKTCADSTPIWIMSFKYHTTYLDIGMGCFL